MVFIRAIIVLLLLAIFYQDIKSRAVYWVFFPLLALSFVVQRLLDGQIAQAVLIESGYSAVFFLLQLLVLSLYFSLKGKRLVNISNGLLGLGDILFIFCLCFYFPAINFIAFYIGSLILVIAVWFAFTHYRPQQTHIPLAGLQASMLLLLIFAGWLLPDAAPTSERWFYALINNFYAS